MNTTINKNDNIVVETTNEDAMREPLLMVQPVAVTVAVDTDLEDSLRARPLEVSYADTSGVDNSNATMVVEIEIDESDWDHGEVQPKACRDCVWGFLFLLQFVGVAGLAILGIRNAIKHGSEWLPSSSSDDDYGSDGSQDDNYNRRIIWFAAALLGTVLVVPSVLLNLLLGAFSSMLIQISLVISPLSFFITFIVSLVTINCPVAFFSLLMSIMGVYYATSVWHKVPFATANLKIALASIRDNCGLWILAYAVTLKSCVWSFLWCSAVLEMTIFSPGWVYDCVPADNDDGIPSSDDLCVISTRGKFIALGMILSFFWTSEVVKNIFHTTIAGVVGTWWFAPEEARSTRSNGLFGCCGCTPAIYDSYVRSSFHSLGSIAFGSLLVGILKVFQLIVRCGRTQREQQRRLRGIQGTDFVFCLLQFFVDHLERLMEYINVWAFVYVGLYGYDYWTAGKQVGALFKTRGWEVIINDNLVHGSLSLMSLFISMVTGVIGLLLGFFLLGSVEAVKASVLGFFLGGMVCQILFGVVISAVNTVVVCFADSPNQLRANGHNPEHFRELIEAYRKAYPNECGF